MSYRTNLRNSDHRYSNSDRRALPDWTDGRDRRLPSRPEPFQPGGFPPPQGKHIRFHEDSDEESAPVTGNKRERSWDRGDPKDPQSYRGATDHNGGRDISTAEPQKRVKIDSEFGPGPLPRTDHARSKDSDPVRSSDVEQLNSMAPQSKESLDPRACCTRSPRSNSAPPAPKFDNSVGANEPAKRSRFFDLGRAGVNVLTKIVPGFPATPDADEKQEALEAAVQAQVEIKYLEEQLAETREECDAWKKRTEAADTYIRNQELQYAELVDNYRNTRDSLNAAREELDLVVHDNDKVRGKYEARFNSLLEEKGSLKQQLKALRDNPPTHASKGDDISLDPFSDQVDQVSEAAVKSGVESLNDSIDTFIMSLLEEAEDLAIRHSSSTLPSGVRKHEEKDRLLCALFEYSRSEEKRGFLLDARLHDRLVSELDAIFFSGNVLPCALDGRITGPLLRDMTKREPWSVVQRWRALTATSGANIVSSRSIKKSISSYAEFIVELLASAYHHPLDTFEPLGSAATQRLADLYEEAGRLSLTVRRDILTVRMSVIAPVKRDSRFPPFDPDNASSPWPDMGVVTGDEVIALYKFGLKRQTEGGVVSYLVKPQVTTDALLRFVAKDTHIT